MTVHKTLRPVRAPAPSELVFNREVGPGWYLLRLREPDVAKSSHPGQFVQILCSPGNAHDPLLRRPFSVYDVDREAGTYDVLYTIVGRGTRWMAALPEFGKGEVVDVEGPFGNHFTWPEPAHRVYLVGGGVGVAPLYFFAREITDWPESPAITLCMGARTENLLQGIEDFRQLPIRSEVSTDDGSAGFHGRVTELFRTLLDEEADLDGVRVYGCGPQGMNESLRAAAIECGVRCEICLESLMACAFGICFGCVAPIRRELGGEYYNRRICCEGPVFDARLLYPGIDG